MVLRVMKEMDVREKMMGLMVMREMGGWKRMEGDGAATGRDEGDGEGVE